MKLKTLAIAIAAAAMPFAAQAELKVGGDVTVGYFEDANGASTFGADGSELNFDASEKVGGLTYFGHVEVNIEDAGAGTGTLTSDDQYVGVKGAFGEVRLGDTDNGCDAVDTGWVVSDEFLLHGSGGCKAGDQNNIVYRGARGPVSYAVGYSPDVDNGATTAGEDTVSVGVKGKMGPAAVSLGYESETAQGSNVVLGVSGNFGPIAVGVRANKYENEHATSGEDVAIGYNAQYAAGANKAYVGIGDVNNNDTLFLGYQRSLGSKTTFIAEYLDDDSAAEKQVAVALKHKF